jgi:hypothetical protein
VLKIQIVRLAGGAVDHLCDQRQVVGMNALLQEIQAWRDVGVVFEN